MLALTPPTPFAPVHAGGAIKTYARWTAWQDVDPRAQRYVIKVRAPDGRVTVRPERAPVEDALNPEPDGLPFDLGPDALGRPSIVVGVCASRACHLHIGRLPNRRSRPIGATRQRFMPSAVTFWRKRLAWSDADGILHLRTAAGAPPRVVRPWSQRHARVDETELDGDLLAATFAYEDQRAPNGTTRAVGLANVRTGHRETLATIMPGEGGQQFTGPAFVGGHELSWLLTCWDAGACNARFGVYRRDLRTRRTVFARDRRPHVGFAAPSRTTVLVGPDQGNCFEENLAAGRCRIEQRRLTAR